MINHSPAQLIAEIERLMDMDYELLPGARHVLIEAIAVIRRQEVCICAAIQLPDGEVFRGHRHDDAIHTAFKADVSKADIYGAVQGFITSRDRFVGREEGAQLQRAAGIPSATTRCPVDGVLFSEDLYLRSTKGMTLSSESSAGAIPVVPMADAKAAFDRLFKRWLKEDENPAALYKVETICREAFIEGWTGSVATVALPCRHYGK